MTYDKDEYLRGYGYVLGTEAAEQAWKAKCVFMLRRWPDHPEIEYYRSFVDGDVGVAGPMHLVMGDIQPYKSMIDGTMIESRSKHRAHLKQHNCIEVGNETKHMMNTKPKTDSHAGLKEEIIRQTFARR